MRRMTRARASRRACGRPRRCAPRARESGGTGCADRAARRRRSCTRNRARRTARPALPCPRAKRDVSPSPVCTAVCGEITPSPLCRILWPTKNASSYLSRSSWLRRRLLMSTVPGRLEARAHQSPPGLRPSPSNQRISRPWCLQRPITASSVSGIWRLPPCSAARSMSGKLLCRVSCHTRISSCANCRPVVPVCDKSSGNAFCSSSCENRNAGSERHRLETAALAIRRRRLDFGVLVEKPARILAEDSGEHVERGGRRRALAGLHHAEIGNRRRALRVDLHAARRQLVQREPVALAQGAQLRAEKVALPDQPAMAPSAL